MKEYRFLYYGIYVRKLLNNDFVNMFGIKKLISFYCLDAIGFIIKVIITGALWAMVLFDYNILEHLLGSLGYL